MSKILSESNILVRSIERTMEIRIGCPYNGAYTADFIREVVGVNGDEVVGKGMPFTVSRQLAEVQDQEVTLPDGRVIKVSDVAYALAALGDRFADETLAR